MNDPTRRHVAFAVLAASLSAGAGCSPMSGLIDRHFSSDQRQEAQERWSDVRAGVKLRLAQQLFDAQNYGEARERLREAMALTRTEPGAFILLAKLELLEGRLASAREAIDIARAMPEATSEADYVAGIIAERSERLDDALCHYEDAAAKQPMDSEYLLAVAEMLVALNRPAEALLLVQSRLADFDQHVGLHVCAAETARVLGLYNEAAQAYSDAARIAGDAPLLLEYAGMALFDAGRYEEATTILKPLVDASIARERTHAAVRSRESPAPDRSAESRRSAIARRGDAMPVRAGDSPAVRRILARSLLRAGEPMEALAVLRHVIRKDVRDVDAWRVIGEIGLTRGDMAAALEAGVQLSRLVPEDPQGWLISAYASLRQGDPATAVRASQRAVRMKQDDVVALCLWAEGELARGHVDAAARVIEEAVRIDPDYSPAVAIHARCRAGQVGPVEPGQSNEAPATSSLPGIVLPPLVVQPVEEHP